MKELPDYKILELKQSSVDKWRNLVHGVNRLLEKTATRCGYCKIVHEQCEDCILCTKRLCYHPLKGQTPISDFIIKLGDAKSLGEIVLMAIEKDMLETSKKFHRKKKKPVHTYPAATADEIRKALGIDKWGRPRGKK